MNVVFFNHFHNGDVHVGRGFVRQIMNKMPEVSFGYSHRNPPNLLADIPNLSYSHLGVGLFNEHTSLHRVNDTVYFNTWYAQQHFKHMNQYGITMDSLWAGFDENCRNALGFSLNDISQDPQDFFPVIDYSKFEIGNAQQWITANLSKKILVENGQSLSGQSHNFDMSTIIANVARNHLDKIFILTSHTNVHLPNNCIYSDNIIKKQIRSDLNEISFLGSHCNMVIGKASGVFSFCLTKETLFQKKMKFLCFSNLTPNKPDKFWLGSMLQDKISYSSTIVNSNESNINSIIHQIESSL